MKASRVAAVVGLSALLGSGWLLTDAYPGEIAFPVAGCIHFIVIGLAGLAGARWRGLTRGTIAGIAAAGVGVFVLPGLVGTLTVGAVSGATVIAIFCSVPLMTVFGMACFGQGSERTLMGPSLVGLFGALLIFPVDVPHSMRRVLALIATVACSAIVAAAGVWMFKLMQDVGVAAAIAIVGFAGAILLGGFGAATGWSPMTLSSVPVEVLRCIVFDLPVVWITVRLMPKIPPARLATRFLLAPVVTWVEGSAALRGPVELRSAIALLLMAVGAGMLLVKDESEEVPSLRLR